MLLKSIQIVIVTLANLSCVMLAATPASHNLEKRSISPPTSVGSDQEGSSPDPDIKYYNDGKNVIISLNNKTIHGPLVVDLDNVDETGTSHSGGVFINGVSIKPNTGDKPSSQPPAGVGREENKPNSSPCMPQPINLIVNFFIKQIYVLIASAVSFCP